MHRYWKRCMHICNVLSIFLLICLATPACSTMGGRWLKVFISWSGRFCQRATAHPKIHRSERSSRALLLHTTGRHSRHTCFTDPLQNQQMTGCQSERYSPMTAGLEASSTETHTPVRQCSLSTYDLLRSHILHRARTQPLARRGFSLFLSLSKSLWRFFKISHRDKRRIK